jgi:hypothetical protein
MFLALAPSLLAGAESAESRRAVVEKIETLARNHAEDGVSKQTDLVIERFANNSVGLDKLEIAEIYEQEYARASSAIPGFVPWVLAGSAFLLALILRDVLKSWITAGISRLGNALYGRLAGTRLLRRFALAKYERALLAEHENVFVPFRKNLPPLKMTTVFVPLKVHAEISRGGAGHDSGAGSKRTEEAVDVFDAIEEKRALVVLGAPGSGKTMLLRRIALAYADRSEEFLPDEPIPVLLDLHRLASEDTSIEEQLREEFARNDFPRAEKFIAQALARGTLMLLLDGLDEVNSQARRLVVQQIRDLMDTHEKCRVIVTCRVAVYEDEFDDVVDKTLEIVEFSDQQVQQFLSAWQDEMPPEKSIQQLLSALRDRPRIMTLARNPLLLTIIAFLYSDPSFILPRSRAEFYQKATTLLLELWHKDYNNYREREKRSVLRHLAIQFYDVAERQEKDRRSVDFETVLEDVKTVLPSVDLDPRADAQPLLTEIVERSGLLLAIDGGQRYQFAHLTLQEFFAAEALLGDDETLFQQFHDDPDAWREVVKLWCGLANDSTELIGRVREIDPFTAFECLADAQKVDSVLVDQLLEEFQGKLSEGDEVIAGFASVASDPRGRGAKVFAFLEETLRNDADEARRYAAAAALSQTNRSEAAETLAWVCDEHPAVITYLGHMGDLAVPPLSSRIRHAGRDTAAGESRAVAAMDELDRIATPQAAACLAPFLWDSNRTIAMKAAWQLARMVRSAKIEVALRTIPDWDPVAWTTTLPWLWEPFGESQRSPLSAITGRVSELLSAAGPTEDESTRGAVDPRFLVPLAVGLVHAELGVVPGFAPRRRWVTCLAHEARAWIEATGGPSTPRPPDAAAWRSMFAPAALSYESTWQARVADALAACVGASMVLVALVMSVLASSWLWPLSSGGQIGVAVTLLFAYAGATLTAGLAYILSGPRAPTVIRFFAFLGSPFTHSPPAPLIGRYPLPEPRIPHRFSVDWGRPRLIPSHMFLAARVALPLALVAGATRFYWVRVGLAVYVLALAVNGWLIRAALVRHRRAQNPFAGLFAPARRRKTRRRRRAWFRRVRQRSVGRTGQVPRSASGGK